LSEGPSSPPTTRQAQLLALAGELRPELHRYCARLMGSVIDGEDVVQDTFARAFVALDELKEDPPLRAWLFRIAHNRALDLLRSRAIRAAEPIEAAQEVADPESLDPVEMLMRREAVNTALRRFVELPTVQRSVVILKDVLDQSLEEIAAMLDLTVNAVKAHLARGRARLEAINAKAPAQPAPWPAMLLCSTGKTGTGCARCWPTTCGWSSPRTRCARAQPTWACSSASIRAPPRCGSPPPGSMAARSSRSTRIPRRRSPTT
jgi:RNA polymerase sigma-70 factor (ECF subfamily)